jgi:hypothetical protein
MGKRLPIWGIFMTSRREAARTWSKIHQAVTKENFEKIVSTCDGVRALLLDLRSDLFRIRDLRPIPLVA